MIHEMSTTLRNPDMKDLKLRCMISGIVGLLLGVLISLVVNCTLIEISLSAFFAVYFGILFIVVGTIILWRVKVHYSLHKDTTDRVLNIFAYLIIAAGFMCFLLEKDWYFKLSPILKVPMYTLLGIAVSFALTFSVVDVINYLLGFMQQSVAKPFVESTRQIQLMLGIAMVMGAIFGFIFGIINLDNNLQYEIRLKLRQQEHNCFPLGGLLGFIAGVGNEYLRDLHTNIPYSTQFDDDI